MAPLRTDVRLPCHCWPWISFSTYCQHINIHTHNTGSVIQSVKSMLCVFTGCAGEWQPTVGLTSQWKSASHVHQRSVREWYSEKVHVPLYQMSDGYCRQGCLHRGHHDRGWAERTSRWRRLSVMWSKEACPVHQGRQLFSLTYKTIAAGRTRGLSTSKKKINNNKINPNNNYNNITFPSNPHEKASYGDSPVLGSGKCL